MISYFFILKSRRRYGSCSRALPVRSFFGLDLLSSSPSEGLALGVLRGADGAVAVQRHGVMVQGGDIGLAAWQAGRHVSDAAVGAHAVVPVDVGGLGDRLL